jgi:hypothetical protein
MQRSIWSDRPLGVKLAALVGAGALALGGFAVITVSALNDTGDRSAEILAGAESTGDALEADMMHDAVRADVLQALLSGGQGDLYTSSAADLAEHSKTFRAVLGRIVASDLSPEVVDATTAVTPAVEAYLSSADDIITTVRTNPYAASAAYPQFAQAFSALEVQLPTVGDAITAYAGAAATSSHDERGTAVRLAVIVALAGVLVLALLGWIVTRSVVGPLRRVGAVLAGLATCAAPPTW